MELSRATLETGLESAALSLLGSMVVSRSAAGVVGVRIVEVEAYGGPPESEYPDPASHGWRGPTPRSAIMFGGPGHLYVYRSYGIHLCVNVTCLPGRHCGAVLLRAGEVTVGGEIARRRRGATVIDHRLARGPGNLGAALGVSLDDTGVDVLAPSSRIRIEGEGVTTEIRSGPRVGVSVATRRAWRWWLADSPAVSAYRAGRQVATAARDRQGSDS
ncbi:DNA-3-methyladenine glycosylase [Williamsia sp. CHRR-6]|uniref:DNA-3-methyladenine glycosylase n=1 Tax=Williamsia sp. CHRR-6 TaxID=2835871 RepID=UPI001BDA3C3C|nr:DNA-3-methyladenine glycosylase [Williamsia sp. CHRR-6]MBT0565155.1 DNA-3-methyladenine glycosylase [Williamsia sp. CHRR-6]